MIISHLFISVLYRQLLHTFKMCNMWLQCPEFDASSTSLSLPLHPVSHTEPPNYILNLLLDRHNLTRLFGCRFAVMACCWALDPEERPKFQQLVQCLTEFHAALGAYVWKQALLFYFFFTPKNSNTKSWWTLFIRSTCMKMCLIGWKSRLQPDDFILYSYFGVFI